MLTRLAPLLVLLTIWFLPQRALACACCDGDSRIEPLGWSAEGELLLRHEEFRSCQRRVMIEVYPVGKERPSQCYDLQTAPDKRIACSRVSATLEAKPKSSAALQQSLQALQGVPQAALQGSYVVTSREGRRAARLRLWSLAPSAPRRLLELSAVEYEYTPPGGDQPGELFPLEFVVLLPPGAADPPKKAAVIVRGMDTEDGIGHRGFVVKWIAPGSELETTPDVTWTRALPEFTSLASSLEPPTSSAINTAGVELLKQGKLAVARARFETAVARQPNHVLARYNLACALARQGQPQPAVFQLKELFSRVGPEVAAERRARALVDEDLTSLRGDPEFQRSVCGGTCPAAAPAASAQAAPSASAAVPPSPAPAPRSAPSAAQGSITPRRGCTFARAAERDATYLLAWAALLALINVRRGATRRRSPDA